MKPTYLEQAKFHLGRQLQKILAQLYFVVVVIVVFFL